MGVVTDRDPGSGTRSERWIRALTSPRIGLAILASVIAFAVYMPVFDGEFVFDDRKLVLENDELWRPNESVGAELSYVFDRLTGIFRAEEETQVRTAFRPVRFISLRLDVRMSRAFGLAGADGRTSSPAIFHAHNALLHALNTFLIALLILQLLPTVPIWFPSLFALGFALHPIQTESVAYISGRRDVLFLAFYLLALCIYAKGRRDGGWGRGLILAGVTWLALGAKEMAVSLPIAMLLLEGFAAPHEGDRTGPKRAIDRLPLWLPSFIAAAVFSALLLTRQNPGGGTGWWGGTPFTAFFGSGRAMFEYVRLLVWPSSLSVDYSFDAFPASTGPFSPWTGAVAWLLIAGVLAVAWRQRKKRPELSTAIVLFFVLIAPVAQMVPHPERFAEHHLYLPSLAFFALLVPLGQTLRVRMPEGTLAGVALLLLIWGGLSVARLEAWAGPYPLWKSAAEAYPRCARAHFGWGNAAQQLGRSAEAVETLGIAIDLLAPIDREPLQQGYYLQALEIRAGILATSNLDDDLFLARQHLLTLLSETDTDGTPVAEDAVVWIELLKVRERLGDREGAVAAAERVIAIDAASPLNLEAGLFLAAALAEAGEGAESELALLQTLGRTGNERERARVWYQLGIVRASEELWEEALEAFLESAEAIGVKGRRSSALYKAAECHLHLHSLAEARRLLEGILEDEPRHLPALLSLGEIVLGAGELEDAVRIFEVVLEAVPDDERARVGYAQARARIKMLETPAAQVEDPTRVSALSMLADRLEGENKLDDAIQALLKAETHAEGPAERDRRFALRVRIARLHVRRGYEASRAGDEGVAIVQLDLAIEAYGRVRELATIAERGEPAIEAAEILRVLRGPKVAYEFLASEYEAGVREPRMHAMLGAFALRADDPVAAKRWYSAWRDEPNLSPEARVRAEEALKQIPPVGRFESPGSRDVRRG